VPVGLIAVTLLAYHNSLGGPFVFDDVPNVRENLKLRQPWPIWEAMWGPLNTGVSGRPLVQLSFALNHAMHGLDVAGYHAVNLLLHLATGFVLFGILGRTLASHRLAPRFGRHATPLAFGVTLVWQVHPLLTDTVTYVSGRTEILAALFLLLTLYGVIRGAAAAAAGRRATAKLWYAGAVASCAVGTGAKEILVAAPLLVLLYDRLFLADSYRQALRERGWVYAGLLATLALIPLNLYMADFHRSALVTTDVMSPWDYLKVQSEVLVTYLRLSVWPHPLIIDYAGWPKHPSLSRVLPFALLIVTLLILTAVGLIRRTPAAYAGAWFFLILAPTSSFLPLPTEIATERRMYLPLMGVVALTVLGGYRLLARAAERSPRSRGAAWRVGMAAVAVVVAAGAWRTWARNEVFKDPLALWLDVATRRPNNSRAFDNLAYEYLGRGDIESAKRYYAEAVRIDPSNYTAMNSLATLHMRDRNYDEAVRLLHAALRVRPEYATPYLNLGRIHYERGDLAEAERSLREADRLQSGRPDTLVMLSKVLLAGGETAGAERFARAALQLKPDAAAHDQLGLVLARANRAAEALAAFRTAYRVAPGDRESLTHLAWYLAAAEDPALRNPPEAINIAAQVAQASGGRDVAAVDALALAYAAAGRFGDAAAMGRVALEQANQQGSPRATAIEGRLAAYAAGRMPDAPLRDFGR
jgi:tetratricopeptide (TPR) repeat protein